MSGRKAAILESTSQGENAMYLEVEATYQNGVLKPSQDLLLQEGQKVSLTIHPIEGAARRFCGSLRWTRDVAELHAYLNDQDESSWGPSDI
jgi:predicted DNA-binding antitoxin AbrB/MazE fold protein